MAEEFDPMTGNFRAEKKPVSSDREETAEEKIKKEGASFKPNELEDFLLANEYEKGGFTPLGSRSFDGNEGRIILEKDKNGKKDDQRLEIAKAEILPASIMKEDQQKEKPEKEKDSFIEEEE